MSGRIQFETRSSDTAFSPSYVQAASLSSYQLDKCQGSVSCHPSTFQKTFLCSCVQGIANSLLKQCAVLPLTLYYADGARVPMLPLL